MTGNGELRIEFESRGSKLKVNVLRDGSDDPLLTDVIDPASESARKR